MRAAEFHDVVLGLWDSWEDDAFLRDADSGQYFDPAKLHPLHHRGEHFRARPAQRGALAARPPGGGAGRRLARRPRPGRAQRRSHLRGPSDLRRGPVLHRDIKRRAAGYGRDPDSIKVMPGIFPVVGHSQAEADEKFARLQDLIHPVVGVQLLSNMIGVDLSGHPVDGPLPELPETNGGRSRQLLLADLARRDGLTIRQLYLKIAERAAISKWARPRASPTSCSNGSRKKARTASTSCRPGCPAAWTISSNWCCRNCAGVACSGASTPAAHCASTWSGPAGARAGQRPRAASRHRRLRPPHAGPVTQPERIRPMPSDSTPHIAIIGGGFAGAVTALAGPRCAPAPGHHHRRKPPRAGRGIAYSTRNPAHLMNGPAKNFTLYPTSPNTWPTGCATRPSATAGARPPAWPTPTASRRDICMATTCRRNWRTRWRRRRIRSRSSTWPDARGSGRRRRGALGRAAGGRTPAARRLRGAGHGPVSAHAS